MLAPQSPLHQQHHLVLAVSVVFACKAMFILPTHSASSLTSGAAHLHFFCWLRPWTNSCIACRLGKQRDTGGVGFGNARAVRNLYEQSITRQSTRVLAERRAGGSIDALLLVREDLLGPKHLDVTSSKALRSLAALRGLHSVKRSVDTLLSLVR